MIGSRVDAERRNRRFVLQECNLMSRCHCQCTRGGELEPVLQFFFDVGTYHQELKMYTVLESIQPRLIPKLRERSSNQGPEPPLTTASGYQWPAFIVMDKGESLRDFVNQSTDADMARLHALHALCVLARHLKVGLPFTKP